MAGVTHESPPPSRIHQKKQCNIVDLSKKRKSGNVCQEGRPFLSPNVVIPQQQHSSFFRREQTTISLNTLYSDISLFTENNLVAAAVALHLEPRVSAVKEYFSTINPHDYPLIKSIHNILIGIASKKPFLSTMNPPTPKVSVTDPRYNIGDPIFGPLSLGQTPVHQSIVLSDQLDCHSVILCHPASVGSNTIQWPHSLTIRVNGQLIKPPGIFAFPLIDLSDFGHQRELLIDCNLEPKPFILVVASAKFSSFDALISSIAARSPVNDFVSTDNTTLLDPTTGHRIDHPGRGINCRHIQCFDIKTFLERATFQRQWICPICQLSLDFDQIVYSVSLKSLIDKCCQHVVTSPQSNLDIDFGLDDADQDNFMY